MIVVIVNGGGRGGGGHGGRGGGGGSGNFRILAVFLKSDKQGNHTGFVNSWRRFCH